MVGDTFDINKRVFKQKIPDHVGPGENIGNLIVREKNIMLAKEHQFDCGNNYQLLITKEVFKITKEIQTKKAMTSTFLFTEVPFDLGSYTWPYGFEHRPLELSMSPRNKVVRTAHRDIFTTRTDAHSNSFAHAFKENSMTNEPDDQLILGDKTKKPEG